MKAMIFAAVAALSLGTGVAYAQGLPAGTSPPVYGSHAFSNQPYQNGTIFSRIFGHSKGDQATADRTAQRNTPPAKGV